MTTHPRSMLVLLSALFSLGGCAAVTGPDPVSGEAAEQMRKWEAQGLDDYRFTLARTCFCPVEATQPVRVEVRDDRVVKVTSIRTGQALSLELGVTVEEMFERIATAARDGTYLEAAYHPARAYPAQVVIGTLANDAGVGYSLSDLEAVR